MRSLCRRCELVPWAVFQGRMLRSFRLIQLSRHHTEYSQFCSYLKLSQPSMTDTHQNLKTFLRNTLHNQSNPDSVLFPHCTMCTKHRLARQCSDCKTHTTPWSLYMHTRAPDRKGIPMSPFHLLRHRSCRLCRLCRSCRCYS